MVSLLLIDDEREWLDSFKRTLVRFSVAKSENIFTAGNSHDAFDILRKEEIGIIFLDLVLGNESGEEVLKKIKSEWPHVTVAITTGVNSVQSAVNCIRYGAADYFVKTMSVEELVAGARRIVKIRELENDNIALRRGFLSSYEFTEDFGGFFTVSPKMTPIFKYLTAVAGSSQSILITGESGVGKGILARAAAKISRPGKPFVPVNVAGLDSQMFSDTLFGHVKGAFTGADLKRPGAIQQAGDGVIFLDEIGELPIQSQIKLLYITQDGEYQQLGSDVALKTSARFIFATNQDLEKRQGEGLFRKDLFYRLNTHRVHIPPLRERPEDIPFLLRRFAESAAEEYGMEPPVIRADGASLLQGYSFPGNVRELRALIYDAVAKTQGIRPVMATDFENLLTKSDSRPSDYIVETSSGNLPTVDEVVNELIEKAMKLSGNNQTKAAALIGLSQSTLSRRLKSI